MLSAVLFAAVKFQRIAYRNAFIRMRAKKFFLLSFFLSPFNFSPGFKDGKISAFFLICAFVFSRFKSVYALFGFFRFFVFRLQFLSAPPAARNLAGTLVLFDFRFFCPACFTRILLKALWRKSEGRKPRWCRRWKKPRGFLFSVSAFQFRFL